eukprot:UN20119
MSNLSVPTSMNSFWVASNNVTPASSMFEGSRAPENIYFGTPQRWSMLFVVGSGGFFNGASYTFMAPIEDTIRSYFGVSTMWITFLIMGLSMNFLPSTCFTE